MRRQMMMMMNFHDGKTDCLAYIVVLVLAMLYLFIVLWCECIGC